MRSLAILAFFPLLAACQSGPYPISSPYFQIPAGSKLVLKQTLTIPPNAGRIYIQYGKVVTPKEKDDWHAHCWFLSWDVLDTAQKIEPDTFIITHSQQLEDTVMRHTKLQYAMNRFGFPGGDGGPMAYVYSTEMWIHSDSQPAIRRFTCSHWEDPLDANHLTVKQMQQALGLIAQIQLNLAQ